MAGKRKLSPARQVTLLDFVVEDPSRMAGGKVTDCGELVE